MRRPNKNLELFQRLYQNFYQPIFRYLFIRLSGLKDQAYDLTAETFFSLWKNIDKLDPERNPKSFIFTIARNKLIDFKKSKAAKNLSLDDIRYDPPTNMNLDKLNDKLLLEKVIKEINSILTPKERDVILLRYLEDLDDKEIAKILNANPTSIRVINHRAIKKLKKEVNDSAS